MSDIKTEDLVPCDRGDPEAVGAFLRSQGIGLTTGEYERVCDLLGRPPTIVELHIFNTMWSEHCSYKSSRPVLKKYLPTEAPHVVLGPGEDAGIIRFASLDGRSYCLVMAHESHNHPSQVLPVEGAATGIGGIVRDVYCMGADVVGVMDPLRFGDPEGRHASRVRDITWGVVDGIAQYGNALGVPNFGGDTYFDASYDDNCLVNVVAFGVVEEEDIIRSRVPGEAGTEPYAVILVGKPTDASGFGGAVFASERLSEQEAVERQGAVQVPDPFLKRVLTEATKSMLAWAKSNGVKIGFKDLGAGGISCAVSEMAQAGGMGASVVLDRVNCAFADMPAEVISCSETQERYLLTVPARLAERVVEIYNDLYELPNLYTGAGAYVIGEVTPDKRFKIVNRNRLVCDADVDVITTGIVYDREAVEKRRHLPSRGLSHRDGPAGARDVLLLLLSSFNVSDKSAIFQHYDSEVQGRAVIRPGEGDAAVSVLIPGREIGLATSCGGNSRLAAADPYLGGVWSVCEAVRNVVCVGAKPLAITDCLNFGDPEDPAVFHEFSEAVRGIGDACRALEIDPGSGHGVPVISGNVSFYNQSETGNAIAPTPIVSCAGRLEDVSTARSMSLKRPGSKIYFLGTVHDRTGGSEYERYFGGADPYGVPQPDFKNEVAWARVILDGFAGGVLLSAHDVSQGGIAVTAAEMVLASAPFRRGFELDLSGILHGSRPVIAQIFSEYGGYLVEVATDRASEFEATVKKQGAPAFAVGTATDGGVLGITTREGRFEVSFDELRTAFEGRVGRLLG